MKKIVKNLALVLFVSVLTASFTGIDGDKKEIKTDKSKVVWKGYKVTGSHTGTIDIKEGALMFDGEKLTGGQFVIDMSTINTTDLEGEYKGKLDGHLKSDDFFSVSKFPTAKLVITEVKSTGKNAYDVAGDLTIKGNTKAVSFTMSIYGSKATANLKIDRSKFDVRYNSTSFFEDLKDKAIYDEFDLVADLEF